MKYSSLASSNKNFQSSINLQFDLNKRNKIDTYIPTQQSVDILKKYLNAVYNTGYNEDNATVLIGPYGRGKSHLLLVLSAIISYGNNNIDRECINDLITRISRVDDEAANLIKMVIVREKPMLPVIINSNHVDINQSFILALSEALEQSQLEDFFPETYFDAALSMIDTWENQYERAFTSFSKLLKEKKTTLSKIKTGLKQCRKEDYLIFCEVYPKITNGAEFNPMQNTDIVKMYSKVATALCEQKNYSGIYIIFDEFSKFLESTMAMQNMQNFKIIQDFSELAVRSDESQIHLCCVTHKEILDYSHSENFRTVDGRFKKVYFVASSEQSYELVANAIEHNDKRFNDFYLKHKEQFSIVNQSVYRTGIFNEIDETVFEELIVKKCFPLHPMAVYALIKTSELVGQNERTLFTFLSQSEKYTLTEFLCQDHKSTALCLMTADYIFDYFSELFRIEIFNPKIHSIWAKTNTALKQTQDLNQCKIIKAIAIINIINEDVLLPISNHIKAIVNMSDIEYNYAIDQLMRNHILTLRRNGHYAFLTPNGVDIRKTIKNYIEQGLIKLDRPKILQSAYSIHYILPRQYNSNKCMMRYFRTVFMEANDFENYNGNFSEIKNNADGLIIYLITDDLKEIYRLDEKLAQLGLGINILVCISEKWTDNYLLQEYAAACMLENNADSSDLHFHEELLLYKDDLFKSIQESVNKIYSPSNPNSAYYTCKECLHEVTKPMLLNREISRICNEYYDHTPVINNELINKNSLTAPIKKARAKAIDWILMHNDNIPAMEGYGPEVSVFRSTISVLELDVKVYPKDIALAEIIQIISEYIVKGESTIVSFVEIYATLTSAPYGIRRGIIPIYIAYVMRSQIDKIVLYLKNKEIVLTGEVFNNIDDNPEDYSFCVEVGTKERNDYVDAIISLFSPDEEIYGSNRRNVALELMQSWFRGMPKFARVHAFEYGDKKEDVKNNIVQLRKKLLMYDVNSYDFLFKFLPEIFECDNYSVLYEHIENFVQKTNSFITEFANYLKNIVCVYFGSKINGSLFSVMTDWYGTLSDKTKKNVFNADINAVMKFISTNTIYDDYYVISQLAKSITMLAIEDWSDDAVDKFLSDLKQLIFEVNNFEKSDLIYGEQNVSITLNIDGVKYEKNLADTEISALAETTLSNMEGVFDDYSDSITAQERIAILLKLLKKEIDQI